MKFDDLQLELNSDLSWDNLGPKVCAEARFLESDHKGILYSYEVKKNGNTVEVSNWSDQAKRSFIFPEKGYWQITCRAKNSENHVIWKELPPVRYVSLRCDWYGSNFTEDILQSLSRQYCKKISKIENLMHTGLSDNVLIMDFIEKAEHIAKFYASIVKRLRKSDKNKTFFIIKRWRQYIKKTLQNGLTIYGKGNIVVLAPLYRFETASEYEKNFNWIMEEVCDVVRNTPGICLLFLSDCNKRDGKLCISKRDRQNLLNEWLQIASNKYIGNIELPQLTVSLEENKLTALLETSLPQGSFWKRFDLLRDGKIVEKVSGNNIKNSYSWELEEPEIYVVQVHIAWLGQTIYRQSDSMFYSTPEERIRYCEFLERRYKPNHYLGQKLYYEKAYSPICDWLIISQLEAYHLDLFNTIKSVHSGFSEIKVGKYGKWNTHILTDGTIRQLQKGIALLSGRVVLNGILHGEQDIPEDMDPILFDSNYGEYSAIYWDHKKCCVFVDLLRFSQIYIYSSNGLQLCSNNYKLLLEAVREIDGSAKLNIDKAAVTLGTPGFQVLMQNFSYKMDVDNVYKLPFYQNLTLDKDGWHFTESETGQILSLREPYHEELYRRLLNRAIEEAKENLNAYVSSSTYDHTILPLTGGLDSRFLFNLVTQLQNTRLPLIDCWDGNSPGAKLDRLIGTSICKMYGYSYDTAGRVTRGMTLLEEDAHARGIRTGVYYSNVYRGNSSIALKRNLLLLYGAGGDVEMRPYIAARYFNAPITIHNKLEDMVIYIQTRMMQNVLIPSKNAFSAFNRFYSEALEQLPSMSVFERIDRHYMDFRHSTHFGSRNELEIDVAMPLQSKTMLRLSHMTFDIFHNIKLNLDLLYMSNPKVAQFPFDDEKNNIAREKLMPYLVIRDKVLPKVDTSLSGDEKRWKESRIHRASSSQKELSMGKDVWIKQKEELPNRIHESIFYVLHELLIALPELEAKIGEALFYSLSKRKFNGYEKQYIYNKIISLLDQYRLLSGEKPIVLDQQTIL